MKKFLPDLRSKSIFELDYQKLIKRGIKGILIDIDNTLVPMHVKKPTKESIEWVDKMRALGFSVCILSNASHKRSNLFKEKLRVKGVGLAFKPRKSGYLRGIAILELEKEQCVMIGDQMFTDIKGANKAGILTVLTDILDVNEHWYVKLKRVFEKLFYTKELENVERI